MLTLDEPSPQEKYTALISSGGKVDPGKVDELFKQLPPIQPNDMLGEWDGGFFDTGHPVAKQLEEIK